MLVYFSQAQIIDGERVIHTVKVTRNEANILSSFIKDGYINIVRSDVHFKEQETDDFILSLIDRGYTVSKGELFEKLNKKWIENEDKIENIKND